MMKTKCSMFSFSFLFLLFSLFGAAVVDAAICSPSILDCKHCVAISGCGYCATNGTCVPGSASGPTYGTCTGNFEDSLVWHYDHSQVVWTTPGQTVTPAVSEVYLKPNDPVNVSIAVKVPSSARQALDVLINQDVSWSMMDDVTNLMNAIPKILRKLLANRPEIYFGLDCFIDKPLYPMRGSGGNAIFDYSQFYNLQLNYNGLQTIFIAATNSIIGNYDCPEASLTGLVQGLCSSNGWRDNSLKMAITISDACPKHGKWFPYNTSYVTECYWGKQDTSGVWWPKANNYDCVDLCQSPTCKTVTSDKSQCCHYYGTGEQYPTYDGTAGYILKQNVYPVFAAGTDTCADSFWYNNQHYYKYFDDTELAKCWGDMAAITNGGYAKLTADGSGIVEAIQNGINNLTSTLKMYTQTDTYSYVKKINPPSFTGIIELNSYTFKVLLSTTSSVYVNTIIMSVQGWGRANISVINQYPCYGCDHVANSGKVIDLCDVCGGNNACLDCSKTPYGFAEVDVCGICNGDSLSCRDCNGVVNGTSKSDGCGVCGGDGTSCLDYDICGVYNGTNACLDCAFNIWGNLTYDKCMVCGGHNECGKCDSAYTLEYDDCGVCGGNGSECYDCNREKWGKAVSDVCGVCGGNGSTCIGCDGVSRYEPYEYDKCGICNGDSSTCLGCDGNLWGATVACGVCGGDLSDCADCNGTEWGTLEEDSCGQCKDPSSTDFNSCIDCFGVVDGTAKYDDCYVCNGTNACLGCPLPDGTYGEYDDCGVCGGDGSTCYQYCDGGTVDLCGVCNGDNACAGCDLSNPGKYTYDNCGVCGGTDSCLGCDGVPYSGLVYDDCDECGGFDSCYGCDDVPWSYATYDDCGVCGGGNDCVCDNLMWAVQDSCGVCGGDNSTCAGCDGVPNSGAYYDQCGVCQGNDSCVGGCFNIPWGFGTPENCSVCGADSRVVGCDGVCFSGATYDDCGVCAGNNTCYDCSGPNWHDPPYEYDACWVCGGDNTTCLGCDDKVNSGKAYDDCGVCGGSNDCYGCDNRKYSPVKWDDCGVCGGNNSCYGCDNQPGMLEYDVCGVCGGNASCLGCDGEPYSGLVMDKCSVCGGNNTCVGCDGVAYSSNRYDQCGVCKGSGVSCLGCDLVLWSNTTTDICGVCGGHNECLGCDSVAYSYKRYDSCGVCGGNYSCLGCDGVLYSGKVKDACGKCGGNATTSTNCKKSFPSTPLVALGVVVGVVIFLVGLIIVCFFLYKHLRYGNNWYIPNALLTDAGSGAVDNPIFQDNEENKFFENPNYEDGNK